MCTDRRMSVRICFLGVDGGKVGEGRVGLAVSWFGGDKGKGDKVRQGTVRGFLGGQQTVKRLFM